MQLSPGTHKIGVRATGIRGGCNVGYLSAWGGNLRIETGADADNGIGWVRRSTTATMSIPAGVATYSRISDYIIMVDEVTLADAARILGVTARQAQRLAAHGELGRTRTFGRTVVVDPAAVYRIKNSGAQSRGRPALPETAWIALDILSGRPAGTAHEKRAIARLAAMTPIQVARFARRRAKIVRFRAMSRAAQDDIAARLVAGGMLPTGLMSPLIIDWGLAGDRAGDVIDGYLHLHSGTTLRDVGLREDSEGRVSLRIIESAIDTVPAAAVALDLMESMDSRVRHVGQDRLQWMIDGLR